MNNGPVVILDELTIFKAPHQLSACNFLGAVLQEEGLQLSLCFSTQQTQRDGAISTDPVYTASPQSQPIPPD